MRPGDRAPRRGHRGGRAFGTTTAQLARLLGWLAEREVTLVALEATGVYWQPISYALEARFEVWLCNAQHVRNVPGRQTDLSDAEWLAAVVAHGMGRPSFVPPPAIRALRELTRYRKSQIDARVAEVQRLEQGLQDACIKLTSGASKVLTQSGWAMVEALSAGQRDPAVLAELAQGKLRPKLPALREALAGHFGPQHAVAARRILDHLDFLDASTTTLTEQIEARTAPYQAVFELWLPVPGFDRLTIDTLIAETGADMRRFPSPGQLAKWAGVCPGNHEPAGKWRRVGVTPGNRWLRRALLEAARAAVRTKGRYFGAQYRQIAKRRGPNKAAVAVAHSLTDLVWHLLSTGEGYRDLGDDDFQRRRDPERERRRDPERETTRLVRHLEALGFRVTRTPLSTPAASGRPRRRACAHRRALRPGLAAHVRLPAPTPSHGGISPQIEHRLFAHITIHWRGRPLVDYDTVVSLIGATTTATGLTVTARLDVDDYPTGIAVPDALLRQLALQPHATHPQWNYTLQPRN